MVGELYEELYGRHGPQGWWPLFDPSADEPVYRPGDYTVPRGRERTEVAVGAVLAQSTSWSQAARAVGNLHGADALGWERLRELPRGRLEELIRPSRFYRQKAERLCRLARFFLEREEGAGGNARGTTRPPSREALLSVRGVGPETADSILLYGFGVPVMVVDAYLRRVLEARGREEARWDYEELRRWIEEHAPDDHAFFNELHALVVEEGKRLSREN